MSDELAAAIGALAGAVDAVRRDRREERLEARYSDPAFLAEQEARRRPLRKMPFGAFVAGIPDLAEAFQAKVPGNFWTVIEGEVQVPCPCKGGIAAPRRWPEPCPAAERTGCPRWYVYDGRDVRVAFSPRGTEPVPIPDVEPEI